MKKPATYRQYLTAQESLAPGWTSLLRQSMGWFVGPYYDIIDTAIRHDGEGPAFHSFAIDMLVAAYLIGVSLPENSITIPIALYFVPDVGLQLILILLLAIVWGAIRTFLMLKALYRKSKVTSTSDF